MKKFKSKPFVVNTCTNKQKNDWKTVKLSRWKFFSFKSVQGMSLYYVMTYFTLIYTFIYYYYYLYFLTIHIEMWHETLETDLVFGGIFPKFRNFLEYFTSFCKVFLVPESVVEPDFYSVIDIPSWFPISGNGD